MGVVKKKLKNTVFLGKIIHF